MQPEFSDELISAYLDGELTAEERALVEQHLAASEADHQLLNDLRVLQRDLGSLPGVRLDDEFANRVVQAAVAAQAAQAAQAATPAPASRSRKHWQVVVAIVAGLAASLLIVLQPWWFEFSGRQTPGLSPSQRVAAVLLSQAPAEGEALVVRLRLPPELSDPATLAAALQQAGIESRDGTAPSEIAQEISQAYQQDLAQRVAAGGQAGAALAEATVPAASALLVEAPLGKVEAALTALATSAPDAVELLPEAKVAVAESPWSKLGHAEGEGSAPTAAGPRAKPATSFVQHLPANAFRLKKRDGANCATPSHAPPSGHAAAGSRPVYVLILVERADAGH